MSQTGNEGAISNPVERYKVSNKIAVKHKPRNGKRPKPKEIRIRITKRIGTRTFVYARRYHADLAGIRDAYDWLAQIFQVSPGKTEERENRAIKWTELLPAKAGRRKPKS